MLRNLKRAIISCSLGEYSESYNDDFYVRFVRKALYMKKLYLLRLNFKSEKASKSCGVKNIAELKNCKRKTIMLF